MSGVNKFIGIGNLTKDPEVKFTADGLAISRFSIATQEQWKDKDGKKQDKVEFIRIVVFGKLAEICGEYLAKGKQVYIEGRIQTRSWDDEKGVKHYMTEIVANSMKILSGKTNDTSKNTTTHTTQDTTPATDEEEKLWT